MHDLINSIAVSQIVAPQTIQATALTSSVIDRQGAESLALAIAVGDIADTLDADNRIDISIEHADENEASAFAACTDADMIGVAGLTSGVFLKIDAAAKENRQHVAGYNGGKRFVRVIATPVSLATGGAIAVLALKGNLAQSPQA